MTIKNSFTHGDEMSVELMFNANSWISWMACHSVHCLTTVSINFQEKIIASLLRCST